MTEQVSIARPKRWDKPFDPKMTDKDVERVLALPFLKDIDASQFRPPVTLRDILRNDSRIRRHRRGDIIFRDGEYGNSVLSR